MGILDFLFRPKKAEPVDTDTSRYCVGYRDKLQLNSITEDGKRGICPSCGKDCRRTKTGVSFWHIA